MTQDVANENELAGPSSDDGSAQDLDSLLSEFDIETQPPTQAKGEQQDITSLQSKVNQLEQHFVNEQYVKDMGNVVQTVKGDVDNPLIDNDFVESWIETQAKKDARLAQAWANRNSNPSQFNKVVKGLGKAFQNKYGQIPDGKTTDYVESMTDAVRGVQTKQSQDSSPPDYSKMSDQDFNKVINSL